jgi:hypothetical protein
MHITAQNTTDGTMCSVTSHSCTSSPQPIPLSSWTMPKSQTASDCELLELYAEEMFIEYQYLIKDDADTQQNIAAAIRDEINSPKYTTGQESNSCQLQPVAIAVPVYSKQQACRLYPAESTTLLFDIAAFADTAGKNTLYGSLCLEDVSVPFKRPIHQISEHLPTLGLLEPSDLPLQPTHPSDFLCDAVSQLLNYDCSNGNQAQEAASEYASIRPGRLLTRPSPVYSEATFNKRTNVGKCDYSFHSSDNRLYNPEADYERVLRQITGHTFLPGIEHLSSVEARSAFITHDTDVQALQQATAEFLADSYECSFLGDKVSATALPGEKNFLADNDTDIGFSIQYPTAESLLSLIDQVVDSETLVEDFTSPPNFQHQQSTHDMRTSPGTFFNISSSHFADYATLYQLLRFSNDVSYVVCAQSDAVDDVSDTSDKIIELAMTQPAIISHEEAEELTIILPSTLSYFDADTQQCIAYTAFNQLLMDLDNDETLPRIHHSNHGLEEDDFASNEGILEIDERSVSDVDEGLDITVVVSALPGQMGSTDFDFDLDVNGAQDGLDAVIAISAGPRAVDSLRSYSSTGRRARKRPPLAINTHLTDIVEVSSCEAKAQSESSSSEGSIGFADQRGFVQPLSARRSDFLNDEDSDDGHETSQSATPSEPSASTSSNLIPAYPAVEDACELFKNPVWHYGPVLELTFPLTPTGVYSPAANAFPDTDILEAIETEILRLMQYMFQCIHAGRSAELQALGSDLSWALSAIADVFPSFIVLEHLGTTVEILLGIIVASGSN